MQIQHGDPLEGKPLTVIPEDEVYFVVEGRTAFRVRAGADGKSIEVTSHEPWRDEDGKRYDLALNIKPWSSNKVIIRCEPHDK